jgi:hypothetical protein
MLKYGPVDIIALAFGEPKFDGSVFAELERQAASGTIRVLDAMLLLKDAEGTRWSLDIEHLPPDLSAAVGFIDTGTHGLFDSEDADTLYEGMVPGSAVLALAVEHRWAVDLVNTLYAAGVEMAFQTRVPAVVIDEAFAALGIEA